MWLEMNYIIIYKHQGTENVQYRLEIIFKLQKCSERNFIPEGHDSQCNNGKTGNSKKNSPHPEPNTKEKLINEQHVREFQNYHIVVV